MAHVIPEEKKKQWESTKKMVRSVLLGEKDGVPRYKLPGLYRATVFEDLPSSKLGFNSIDAMLRAMPDAVRMSTNGNGDAVYHGVADENTQHISKMVSAQRSSRKKSSGKGYRGRPNKALITRRPAYRPSFRPHPAPMWPTQPQRPYTKSYNSTGQAPWKKPESVPPLKVRISNSNNNSGSSNYQEPLAPRFQKQQQDLRIKLNIARSAAAAAADDCSKSRSQQLLGDYVCHQQNSAVQYDTVAASAGFVSSVTVKGETYGSLGVYKTKEEAEIEAAENACASLHLNSDGPRDSPERANTECTQLEKDRIQKIVQNRPNGLWASRLPVEYKEWFKEPAPVDLIEWAENMTSVVRVEAISGTRRKILYPVGAVRLSQSCESASISVPNVVMPAVGTWMDVAATFCLHPNLFYIQPSDSSVGSISEQLTAIYAARGCPKMLMSAKVGDYCVAKYAQDDCWYRGIIKSCNQEKYEVYYVDFGNTETVTPHETRRMLESVCREPAQALCCSLHNVHPLQSEWPQHSANLLEDLLDVPLRMHIIKVEQDTCVVDIYLVSDPDNSFNDRLISAQLASPVPVAEEPEDLELPSADEWDVYVCYIRSTVDVVVRLVGQQYSDKLEELETELASCVESLATLTVGAMCILQDNGAGHRVKIIEQADSQSKVKVYYVDHGDQELVDADSLCHLPAQFNQLPYQAIECRLSGLEPYEEDEAVLEELVKLALAKTCLADVDERLEDRVSLTLWDIATEEDVNINLKVAQVLKTSQLQPTLPQDGCRVEGYVTEITQQGLLYVMLCSPGLDKLEALHKEMSKLYTNKDASLFVSQPQEDQLVAAPVGEDDNRSWYRAQIKKVVPERRQAEVFYVDYGHTEEVAYSALRIASPQLSNMLLLPHQSIQCRHHSLPHPTSEELAVLSELLVPDRRVHIELKQAADGNQPKAAVDVYVSSGKQLINVASIVQAASGASNEEYNNCTGAESEEQDKSTVELMSTSLQQCIPVEGEWAIVSQVDCDTTLDTTCHIDTTICNESHKRDNRSESISETKSENETESETSTVSNEGDTKSEIAREHKTESDAMLQQFEEVQNEVQAVLLRAARRRLSVTCDEESDGSLCVELPTQPLPSSGDCVYVTWTEHPHNFRCVPSAMFKRLQLMMTDMQDFYKDNQSTLEVSSVELGVYAGCYKDIWYRAVVRAVLNQQVAVSFPDYGDCTILPVDNLRHLAAQFQTLPCQSIKAKLAGVRPVQEEWTEDACERFCDLALNKNLTAWLHGSNVDDLGYIAMTLIKTDESDGEVFVHKCLLADGLAEKP